jgi:hypothetical protein
MTIILGPKLLPFLEIRVTCCWGFVAKEIKERGEDPKER